MKAQELRLKNIIGWRLGTGDLVIGKVHGIEPDKIAISEKETSFDEHGEVESSQGFIKIEGIEPIPLTEDWLLKFGFERNKMILPERGVFDSYLIYEPVAQRMQICKTGYFAYDPQIKYVHQLQNLYYALTGSDLTLKE